MLKSSGRTKEISVMEMEEWPQANLQTIKRLLKFVNGGTPCAMKVACTVWVGGKVGDNIKYLPIDITNITNSPTIERCLWRDDFIHKSSRCVSVMGAYFYSS